MTQPTPARANQLKKGDRLHFGAVSAEITDVYLDEHNVQVLFVEACPPNTHDYGIMLLPDSLVCVTRPAPLLTPGDQVTLVGHPRAKYTVVTENPIKHDETLIVSPHGSVYSIKTDDLVRVDS